MAGISDLLVLGIITGGIYYAYQSGMLNNLFPGAAPIAQQQQYSNQLPTEEDLISLEGGGGGGGEEEEDQIINKEKKKKKKDKDEGVSDLPSSSSSSLEEALAQGPPPRPIRDMYGNPLGYNQTGTWQNRNILAPPPGAQSSLYPMQVPSGPPYISPTVNTYSQYSPYNQFSQYQQYQTPQTGYMQTAGDDNVNFFDIDTSRPGCNSCKSACMSNPYGWTCRSCRMSCKKLTHYYKPPQTGWTITPAGGGGAYSFLGQVWDTLTGGATFAEMDDYSQKKRFDCHNKLKRRARGKDNSFVTQEDYHYDRNDIQVANA